MQTNRITQMLNNENILISDKLRRVEAENRDLEKKYETLKQAFTELLSLHLEMRERWGFGEFTRDYEYDWIEKAGLMDEQ